MKLNRNLSTVGTAVAFALTVNAAAAQVTVQAPYNEVPAGQVFTGADSLNLVMDTLLNLDGVAGNGEIPGLSGGQGGPGLNQGISPSYQGIGSNDAERYMLGARVDRQTSLPNCTPGAAAVNGCQEVAPMSRALRRNVCNSAEYNPIANPNTVAEGLAVASDGIVVLAPNANYQQYSTGACTALTTTPNNAASGDYTLAAPDSGHLDRHHPRHHLHFR